MEGLVATFVAWHGFLGAKKGLEKVLFRCSGLYWAWCCGSGAGENGGLARFGRGKPVFADGWKFKDASCDELRPGTRDYKPNAVDRWV